ncbi:hypothetical protein G7Y89_g9190 [Cudoniella acicularis]|uniref:Uncharacterized protein n=1 Tax=Cudoniella acicularis TaxID=354080 RepID=A0A8H4RHX8_9HELO|nr:hypothetical protein G7Y89_g9190 [Cudoniella acicularis]
MSSLFPAPQNNTQVWRPEPSSRGTFDILSVCLITLISYVWTTVHLNVPRKESLESSGATFLVNIRNRTSFFWRRLAWVLLGLLTPELVAYATQVQHIEAEILHKNVIEALKATAERVRPPTEALRIDVWRKMVNVARSIFPKQQTKTNYTTLSESGKVQSGPDYLLGEDSWKKVYSYFAGMGGFAFDAPKTLEFPFRGRTTFTPHGILFLATYHHSSIPRITAEQIEDKSKADGIAKFIVCMQTTWFSFQCISRVAQGLAISLLKLNTFGHAFCALFAYVQWWKKPLNITEPELVNSRFDEEFWCLLRLTTRYNIQPKRSNEGSRSPKKIRPREARISLDYNYTKVKLPSNNQTSLDGNKQNTFTELESLHSPRFVRCPLFPNNAFAMGNPHVAMNSNPEDQVHSADFHLTPGYSLYGFSLGGTKSIELTAAEIECWRIASIALKRCHKIDYAEAFYRIPHNPFVKPRLKN